MHISPIILKNILSLQIHVKHHSKVPKFTQELLKLILMSFRFWVPLVPPKSAALVYRNIEINFIELEKVNWHLLSK